MNQESLRDLIREMLAAGKLPRIQSDRTWGGRGSGRTCAACGEPIAATAAEIEDHNDAGTPLVFHARCHILVNAERDSVRA